MSLWSSTEVEIATGGTSACRWEAGGVSIDSRALSAGDLFLALSDRRDGHDFVGDALGAGAAAAVVSKMPEGVGAEAPLLMVEDVLDALTRLGEAGRRRCSARIIAVTGSVGKTSTKEMLRHVLERQGATSAAVGSYNNHWGVPLTLARIPVKAGFAVIEIGMSNPGEILPLARLTRPDVAMVTAVGPAHLASFGTVEKIAEEKADIIAGLGKGGVAIVNGDFPSWRIVQRIAAERGVRLVSYGRNPDADWRLLDVTVAESSTILLVARGESRQVVKLAARGSHFAENALGVLAAVEAVGADPVLAALELGTWIPPDGRGMRYRILLGEDGEHVVELVDDAYNANPVSMSAALESLAHSPPAPASGRASGRRVAILGDMLELGERAGDFHAEIANHDSIGDIDIIHCSGDLMQSLHDALPAGKRGRWSQQPETLGRRAHELVAPGDVVLVKGSKGSRVSVVADAIRRLGEVRPVTGQGMQ